MRSSELRQCLQHLAKADGLTQTEWPGLVIAQLSEPMPRTPVVYVPSLCVVAQGRKLAHLRSQSFEYNPHNYLLCSLPLPIESEIVVATRQKPLLAMVLKFDPAKVGKLLVEMEEHYEWPRDGALPNAVAPCEMTDQVHHALTRFLAAVADPLERRVLGAGLERELLFEVLRGDNGNLLRQFVLRDNSAHRIARVVHYLEKHYRDPLDIRVIAEHAGMSASSLHDHFKRATSLSPIQFVKRMRLHEARAQLLGGRATSEAAYSVGYSSASQFSREFRRMFGQSPSQVTA